MKLILFQTFETVNLNDKSVFSPSQILKRGCYVNDRDGLTDMTLLHYSCKAGAHGVGKKISLIEIRQSVCSTAFADR